MQYRLTKTHRHRGVLWQAGRLVSPSEAELRAFPDRFEEIKEEDVPEEEQKSAPVYTVVARGGGWYDVVDEGGNPQNEEAMRMADAETLRQELLRKHT